MSDLLVTGKVLRIEGGHFGPLGEEGVTAAGGAEDFRAKEVFQMPGFDETGPMGAGPMTGGGRGYCNPAYAGWGGRGSRVFGYGRRRGRGFRRGFGPGFGWGPGYARAASRGFYPMWDAGYGPAYGARYANPYGPRPEDELQVLREEADAVKSDLEGINKHIQELESRSSPS